MDISFDVSKVFAACLAANMRLDKYRNIIELLNNANVDTGVDF